MEIEKIVESGEAEKCLYKILVDDAESTTGQDMIKYGTKCVDCKGYDGKCPEYVPQNCIGSP